MFTCIQLKTLKMLVITVIALVNMAGEVKGHCSVTGTEAVARQWLPSLGWKCSLQFQELILTEKGGGCKTPEMFQLENNSNVGYQDYPSGLPWDHVSRVSLQLHDHQ